MIPPKMSVSKIAQLGERFPEYGIVIISGSFIITAEPQRSQRMYFFLFSNESWKIKRFNPSGVFH
jgi:hypothetical protein